MKKRKMPLMLIAILGCLAVACLLLGIYGLVLGRLDLLALPVPPGLFPDSPYWATAVARVHVGDDRDSAVRALSDAWFHSECGNTDIFVYGPNDPNRATIIYVTSYEKAGTRVVDSMGTIPPEMLSQYEYCLPESLRQGIGGMR